MAVLILRKMDVFGIVHFGHFQGHGLKKIRSKYVFLVACLFVLYLETMPNFLGTCLSIFVSLVGLQSWTKAAFWPLSTNP